MKKVNIEEYKKDGQIDYDKLLNKAFVVETDENSLRKFGFESDEKNIVKEYTLLDYHLNKEELFLKVKDLNKDVRWISVTAIGKLLFVYEKEDKPEPEKDCPPINDEWNKWKEILEKMPKTTPAPWEKFPPCPYTPPQTPWHEKEPWKRPQGPGYWPDYITTCEGCGQTFKSNEAIGYVCGNSHCPMGLGGVFCGLTITR
jgi:hypothetical protein